MKSKARRVIEKWGTQPMPGQKLPVALGTDAVVVMFPANTVGYDYYVTARYVRRTAKREFVEYVCSCPGFQHSTKEVMECHHVKELWESIEAAASN